MIATCYQIDDTLKLTSLTPEEAVHSQQRGGAQLWVDLQEAKVEDMERWLTELGISRLSRRLCVEARDRAGFYPLTKEMVLVLPTQKSSTETGPDREYLTAICHENLLVTLHGQSLGMPDAAMLEGADSWLPDGSIGGLLSAMLIRLSLESLGRTTDLRETISTIEERMDRDPESVTADEIVDLRSELLSLGATVSDQLPPVQGVNATDKPLLQLKGARDYLNCALVNLQAADASLEWLDQRIGSPRSGFDMHAQDKTNRRLNMLTILSAVFMPITLMAGIWGMNFEGMPELGLRFAYPVALGCMLLVGLGMYHFFRKTGWLD